jgi:hypothetical protein
MAPAPLPEGSSPRHRRVAVGLLAVAVLIALIVIGRFAVRDERPGVQPAQVETTPSSVSGSPASTTPQPSGHGNLPLRGGPLQGGIGLRLLVADAPAPFILDVEQGSAQQITGLPTKGDRDVGVAPVGEDALVLSYRYCKGCTRGPEVFLLRRESFVAARLGTALVALPASDGEGVWLLTRHAGTCTIREEALGGRLPRAARRVRCGTEPVAELPAGLLATYVGPSGRDAHSALLRPTAGVVRIPDPWPQPVVGNLVLTGGDRHTPLLLEDVKSGASHRLRWPSRPSYSLSEVTGEPSGHLAIVEFARYSPGHKVDMWLLDTQTRRWEHLPGMPARLVAKVTETEWTPDGRVVILSSDAIGVWRPGEPRLSVARVKTSKRPGAGFVIW